MRVGDHTKSGDGDFNRAAGKLRRGDEGSRSLTGGVECSSPARAVSRLLAIMRRCRGGKRERECWERRRRREKVHALKVGGDANCESPDKLPEKSPENCPTNSVSGSARQEMTFNLAAGLGLLSLIAASKTELDKTISLRREMEVYLRTIKEEQHQISNGTTPKPLSDPGAAYAVITTVDGLSNNLSPYSLEDHAPSLSRPESGISLVCDKHCTLHEKKVSVGVIDNLEEQLAAELERLQLHIETRESSEDQEEVNEITSTNTGTQSASLSFGEEVVDPQDDAGDSEYFTGVPPLELERRLHELLEMRQEERIRELEAHLECMSRKLQEKEVEVTWWKDTAKIISKQVPESSQLRGSLQ